MITVEHFYTALGDKSFADSSRKIFTGVESLKKASTTVWVPQNCKT